MNPPVLPLCEMLLSLPASRRGTMLLSALTGSPVIEGVSEAWFDSLSAEFLGRFEAHLGYTPTLQEVRDIVSSTMPVRISMEFGRLMMTETDAELLAVIDGIVSLLVEFVRPTADKRQRRLFDEETNQEQSPHLGAAPSGGVVSDLRELVDNGFRFPTIYADPPWEYDNSASRGAASNHYHTMSLEAICREPVKELADENSHLHLWTTSGFLREAFQVIEAWGFEYKSGFVWVKRELGMGNYWRLSHEYLLLGVRGRLTFRDRALPSWLEAPRTVHSRKPSVIRCLIERVSPGPYLELYGREALPNSAWTVYGNQIERRLF